MDRLLPSPDLEKPSPRAALSLSFGFFLRGGGRPGDGGHADFEGWEDGGAGGRRRGDLPTGGFSIEKDRRSHRLDARHATHAWG